MLAEKDFISISDNPFSRRGSYLCLFCAPDGQTEYGRAALHFGNLRGMGPYRQVRAELVKDGVSLPVTISTTESEVILKTEGGSVRFCIGERRFLRMRGTDGLTLRLSVTMPAFSGTATDLRDGCWQFDLGSVQAVLLPFAGRLEAHQAFGGPLGGTVALSFDLIPDENGVVDAGVEEFLTDPIHRPLEEYPSYEDCVRSFEEEFETFCAKFTPLPPAWEPLRRKALWTIWTLTVEPDGETMFKHTMIKMLHGTFEHVSGWQQGMHIVCLSRWDPALAWGILRGLFDYQDANGRIADIITDASFARAAMKPPIQGLALNWLLDHTDPAQVPQEDLRVIYEGMVRWSEFFFKCRDIDGDGIFENRSCMETGWEDAPFFKRLGWPIASPDMNAYLALQLEAQARLGRVIGESEERCAAFEAASRALIDRLVKTLWDGERWFALNPLTGRRSDTQTLSLYCTLVLGKRLPREVVDKSLETLLAEGKYLTPFGIATEALDSPFFAHGFAQGSIIPPAEFLMVMAMEACGRPDLAADIARRYLKTLRDFGLFHTHDALTGRPDRSMVALDEKYLFWSAWSASIYLFFADRYGGDAG